MDGYVGDGWVWGKTGKRGSVGTMWDWCETSNWRISWIELVSSEVPHQSNAHKWLQVWPAHICTYSLMWSCAPLSLQVFPLLVYPQHLSSNCAYVIMAFSIIFIIQAQNFLTKTIALPKELICMHEIKFVAVKKRSWFWWCLRSFNFRKCEFESTGSNPIATLDQKWPIEQISVYIEWLIGNGSFSLVCTSGFYLWLFLSRTPDWSVKLFSQNTQF